LCWHFSDSPSHRQCGSLVEWAVDTVVPQQLTQQRTLLPVYIVCGDEPLLRQEACDDIRALAQQQGFSQHDVFQVDGRFNWALFHSARQPLSLFSEKKIIELRLTGKPGKAGSDALMKYIEQSPTDLCLLISGDKLDQAQQKTRWFKALEQQGAFVPIWPIRTEQLPQWLQQRAKRHALTLTADAANFLATHVEGNLLAASQTLEKLGILYSQQTSLNTDDIQAAISDQARFSVFALIDTVLAGNVQQSLRVLKRLREEGSEVEFISADQQA